MMIAESQWLEVLTYCGVRAATAAVWAPAFVRHVQPEAFSLGAREIDDFVGQVLHETARLEKLEENLNYRPERLMQVWPARFTSLAIAKLYAYNPEALANFVYGKRMGNIASGDGYRYRGRGIPMITGLDGYLLLERLTGLPLVAHPERLTDPDTALRCGVLWWEKRVPDHAIDSLERVSRAVQGGDLALGDRQYLTGRASVALA